MYPQIANVNLMKQIQYNAFDYKFHRQT